jgi:hypothetical protein
MSAENPLGSAQPARQRAGVPAIADFAFEMPSLVGDSTTRKDRFGATPKVRAGLASARKTPAGCALPG